MPRFVRTLCWLALPLGLTACVPPLSMREAKPGDRVVCESTPNRFYLSGWNYYLSPCYAASRVDPDAMAPRERQTRTRSRELPEGTLRQ